MLRTPNVIKNLLIINIIFFLAQNFLPFGNEMTNRLALHYWLSPDFKIYQLVTYMFLHANFQHLLYNMFALWMFGRISEMDLGSRRFFSYYFITGIGAGILNMLVLELEFSGVKEAVAAFISNPTPTDFSILLNQHFTNINESAVSDMVRAWSVTPDSPAYISNAIETVNFLVSKQLDSLTIGASGAVFGILLSFGLLHPNERIVLLIPPIPMKAKYFVMGYAAIELLMGISNSNSSIAHFAHLGGMLWGWALLYYWKKKGYIHY